MDNILNRRWNIRDGRIVPNTPDVALAGGGVRLDATFLYADLRHSTYLASNYQNRTAAKVIKCFIYCATAIIKLNKGTVTSFDGDRVMGVFVGNEKNSQAAKAGLQINWSVQNVVEPKVSAKFTSIKESGFDLRHGVGIDTGSVLTVRAGVRGINDLIWIGRAPNLAAKFSDITDAGYSTFIHQDVYSRLAKDSRYTSQNVDMWESRSFKIDGTSIPIYRSGYRVEP